MILLILRLEVDLAELERFLDSQSSSGRACVVGELVLLGSGAALQALRLRLTSFAPLGGAHLAVALDGMSAG